MINKSTIVQMIILEITCLISGIAIGLSIAKLIS